MTSEFDAGAKVTTIAKTINPTTAQPGTENTQCITVNLNNPEGVYARRFRADLTAGSHHMIAYTSTKTAEEPAPKDCKPFSGIPVGFEIEPNQMVKIEMHYINTTIGPLDVMGKVSFDTVPLTTLVTKSDLAFWGTTAIDILANSTGDTGVLYQPALAGTRTFALTTHQHQLGTEMLVWYGDGANDPNKMQVADAKNWADPPLELFSPALDFPANDGNTFSTKGLAFECKWNNTTPNPVQFGEGFNDEMCFLWQYYFPSQGFQICVNSFCKSTP